MNAPKKDKNAVPAAPAHQAEPVDASVYRPKPWHVRPGSDDFTRLPSLHRGQRLPFTGGYVAVAGSKS